MKALTIFTFCCIATLFISCKNDVDTKNLTSGKWHVADLKKNVKQQKEIYKDYTFRFYDNHKIYALFNNLTYQGTWSTSSDFATDDEPQDNKYLTLNFNKDAGVAALNGEYILISNTKDSLTLKEENVNTAQVYLVMAKVK